MINTAPRICTTVDSPLGPLLLARSAVGLAGVWFVDQRHRPTPATVAGWEEQNDDRLLCLAAEQLASYFSGSPSAFRLPLDLSGGTPFQQAVWRTLLNIPASHTRTYTQVALDVGRPAAVRAVGTAIGRNPLGIVVPCHRVLGSSGALTGYAGGLDRKAALLRLERGDGLFS